MKRIFYPIILIVFLVLAYNFIFLLSHCKNFQEIIHLHFDQLLLQIHGEMSMDYGLPLLFVRIFHNKVVDAFLIIIKTYFRFWDTVFQGQLIPFIGGFGIVAWVYYFFSSKVKKFWQWLLLLVFISTPFIELSLYSKTPFLIRISSLYLFFGFISLLGIRKFITAQKWGWFIILILIIVSVWWILTANSYLPIICYQYP